MVDSVLALFFWPTATFAPAFTTAASVVFISFIMCPADTDLQPSLICGTPNERSDDSRTCTINASTKITLSLCGSSGGLTRRAGVGRDAPGLADGRVGVVRDVGRVGVVGDGVRVGGLRGGVTRAGVESSRSAECTLRLRAANTKAAAITIVFADFMTSPFKSLCISMSCLSNIIGKKHTKGYKKNPFFIKPISPNPESLHAVACPFPDGGAGTQMPLYLDPFSGRGFLYI